MHEFVNRAEGTGFEPANLVWSPDPKSGEFADTQPLRSILLVEVGNRRQVTYKSHRKRGTVEGEREPDIVDLGMSVTTPDSGLSGPDHGQNGTDMEIFENLEPGSMIHLL